MPGTSLADHLAQHGRLPIGEAVAVVRDIAAALMTAHSAGVVHRDVKPANIILAPDRRALLTDFGVARQDAEETIHGSVTEVTGHGLVVGSLRYIAPEQLRGEPATPASDQYGLAAVASQMLTGRPPFDGATPIAIAEAHAAGPPTLSDVDPRLADAVRRGLAVDPGDRFPNVAALAAAIGAAVRPVAAADATQVVPVVVPAVDAVDAADAVDDPEPRAGSGRRPAVAIGALVVALGFGALVAFAALDQPRSPGGDAVTPPSQQTTAAPTEPPTAEPAVNAGGKADGANRGNDGDGKAKGRDGNDNGKGKGKN